MSYSAAYSAFITYLVDNYVDTPVDYPNSPSAEPALPFIKVSIIDSETDDFTMGLDSINRVGVFDVTIVAAMGTGVGASNTIADNLVNLLKDAKLADETRCGVPFKQLLGTLDGRYLINITVPFERVEF